MSHLGSHAWVVKLQHMSAEDEDEDDEHVTGGVGDVRAASQSESLEYVPVVSGMHDAAPPVHVRLYFGQLVGSSAVHWAREVLPVGLVTESRTQLGGFVEQSAR